MCSEADNSYQCQLDEASRKKAKDELNELNDRDRDSAVEKLRTWVLEQENWLKSPTDYSFLLRFLRVRKYSQLEARNTIERYWLIKTQHPSVFHNFDPNDKLIQEMLSYGFFLCPKKLDKDGCRIIIGRVRHLPTEKIKVWGVDNIYKLMFMLFEWMMMDEHSQVHGIKCLWEYTGLTMGHIELIKGGDINKTSVKFQEKCMPARNKGQYLYNEPHFIELLLTLFTPFMSQKLQDRMKLLGPNLHKLYDYMGKEVLLDEYLPDDYTGPSAGTDKQVMEEMVAELTSPAVRQHLQKISSEDYKVDLDKKPKDQALHEVASFRKLNID